MEYIELMTEKINDKTVNIDICPTIDIITQINEEDKKVAEAVSMVKPKIAKAVDIIAEKLANGGRLLYVGAGTSGRLGILDASECPPTYGTEPEVVQGLIAGGHSAFFIANENVEDNYQLGGEDILAKDVTDNDVVVGISASGTARYVIGALNKARELGAKTIGVSNTSASVLSKSCDIIIEVITGPEVIMGSTRMKAGTAQKMVLNMLTTASMIKIGKVYKNLMVDLKANNDKLRDRKVRIVMLATNIEMEKAVKYLDGCNQNTKEAIVSILAECDYKTAQCYLEKNNGFVRKAIKDINGLN